MSDLCEVIITAPDSGWLLDFTRRLVDERLCAAAHNFTPVTSVYPWAGAVHQRQEGRASLHTRVDLVPATVRLAEHRHPYQVPSISTRPINNGNPTYLQWIRDETTPVGCGRRGRGVGFMMLCQFCTRLSVSREV